MRRIINLLKKGGSEEDTILEENTQEDMGDKRRDKRGMGSGTGREEENAI